MSTQPATKFTYEDYLRLPDDGLRHESIDGEHYVVPSPNFRHQSIAGNLFALMWWFLEQNPIGKVYSAPLDVIFDNENFVEPDILYVSNERAAAILKTWVHGAPNLVVEVLSDSTKKRDKNEKRRLYGRFGVEEYWIVDPMRDIVEIYRRQGTRYELAREVRDRLTTPLLPGLEIDLARVFRG